MVFEWFSSGNPIKWSKKTTSNRPSKARDMALLADQGTFVAAQREGLEKKPWPSGGIPPYANHDAGISYKTGLAGGFKPSENI